jgi:hypothetical protein
VAGLVAPRSCFALGYHWIECTVPGPPRCPRLSALLAITTVRFTRSKMSLPADVDALLDVGLAHSAPTRATS